MRRIVIAAMSTLSALVLLFSYHTSTSSVTAKASSVPVPGGSSGTDAASPSTPSSNSTGSGTSSGTSAASGAATSGTFTGDSVATRWGDVQVQITVTDGKVTKSEAIVFPQANPRDQEINAYALPILSEAAVTAQSARIDAISGATVTSEGYLSSLQSALDQAHL
ncbi:FMN-binding protein [Dermatophilaceae bacterium Soc4.6]